MIFGRRQTDEQLGRLDGGEGRGLRLGGSDTGSRPTGYRRKDDPFDDEPALDPSIANDKEPLIEDGEDDNPGDRRRDPLRR